MPTSSPVSQDVTTINYTLSWPHLENPSNTTFAGATQIDICRCGPDNDDLGHVYTRYHCPRPEVRFAPASEDLWVLQQPLGSINLLQPATSEEVQRRKKIEGLVEPSTYSGKNLLLLSGPCPRGRYQAYATLRFLQSLHYSRRQYVESLTLLIQPYEEDCSDDQGGRAYIELARYIIEELPAFQTLYLSIWGEETRIGSREFAMVLWKEGVKIMVSWDWWSGKTEEYTDVEEFLQGIEGGVVATRPAWEVRGKRTEDEQQMNEEETMESAQFSNSQPSPCNISVYRDDQNGKVIWEEVPQPENEGIEEDDGFREKRDSLDDLGDENQAGDPTDDSDLQNDSDSGEGSEILTSAVEATESSWSDAILTPISPEGDLDHEEWSWQVR